MAVTARFLPDSIDLVPGVASTVTLRMHNNGTEAATVSLRPSGDLAADLSPVSSTASMEPNQTVDVTVGIGVPATAAAARYEAAIEVADGAEVVLASLPAQVLAHRECTVELRPRRSRGSRRGRHVIRAVNAGNTAETFELVPDDPGEEVRLQVPTLLTVDAGATADAPVQLVPTSRFWSGAPVEHEFVVRVRNVDGTDPGGAEGDRALIGTYEQRPRVPGWLGPAALGAATALAIGTIAWFALLRPWIEDRAEDAAAEAIEADRAALQERIDELERAAAEAEELPLGEPHDVRLDVAPTAGDEAEASERIDPGTRFSVTDVVFQNPDGAVGTVTLLRDGDVLLSSELANFRDFDLHLVAPYVFEGGSEVVLRVDCRTPGRDGVECAVGASVVGFLDETG